MERGENATYLNARFDAIPAFRLTPPIPFYGLGHDTPSQKQNVISVSAFSDPTTPRLGHL